ncbi:MAG: phosphoribosylamine--glycine ligase [Planctomycetes bacterium]|nr:phosphoribosylamine--glycine ligase [Planctomycetota bacterium]
MSYKIMVVGGGGREHALAWKISQSPLCEKLYLAPGNPLSAKIGECVNIQTSDFVALKSFAKKEGIDLTVVGPEAPLVGGLVNTFKRAGLRIFGPTKAAARLEGSKSFSKELMHKYHIPTAAFQKARSLDEAHTVLADMGVPVVIKADGLAEGKGAFVCHTQEEAEMALRMIFMEKRFGESGDLCVFEEFMQGEEASVFCVTDGHTLLPMLPAQDHKAIGEGDRGANTGGMGSYAPAPVVTEKVMDKILKEIAVPTIHAMNSEGCPYSGVLYIGLMIQSGNPRVVEYNCRFGDPEIQPLVMMMKTDILPILMKAADGNLDSCEEGFEWHPGAAVGVVMASGGYPDKYEKGYVIEGLDELSAEVVPFAAGVGGRPERLLTSGGRVLCLTARGESLREACERVYSEIDKIRFTGAYYRKDIGHRAL